MRAADKIWWNGRLVPWDEAHIHVTSETALRGLNAFEGMRAYWRSGVSAFAIIAAKEHLARLAESARLLQFPAENNLQRIGKGIVEVLKSVRLPDNVYLRPTIYIDQGAYEIDRSRITLGEFISWRRAPASASAVLKCCIATWTHIPSSSFPTNAKTGAAYSVFRLARLEALHQGYDDAILLNDRGRVAETGGGSVFAVYGKTLVTPPLSEGILPSITRRIVMETLSGELGLSVQERELTVDNLQQADEVFVAGTLDEIARVVLPGKDVPARDHAESVVSKLQLLYQDLWRGNALSGAGWVELISHDELQP